MSSDVVCGYKLLRALGATGIPAFAAIDPKRSGDDALCVVEKLSRSEGGTTAEAAAEFLRDAKRLSLVKQANVTRARDVIVATNLVMLVTEWTDGESLADLSREAAEKGEPIALGASLRVIVDLLEGLSALHELHDAKGEPFPLTHAEVAPRNVIVAKDGRAVIVHPLRAPRNVDAKKPAGDVVGYLAPEVVLGDATADRRADVYGAGVLLWEALMHRRMHAEGEAAGEVVVRLLGGKIETPCAPMGAPWASGLVEVTKKATSADPAARYATAKEMLAAIRRVASTRVAPRSDLASLVERLAGDRVRARRAALVTIAEPKDAPPSGPLLDEERITAVPESKPAVAAAPPSLPPPSSEALSAEVLEVVDDASANESAQHTPPPLPARARPAPPTSPPSIASPPPSPSEPRAIEASRTDIASVSSLIAAAPSGARTTKRAWLLVGAAALIALIAIPLLMPHDDKSAPNDHASTTPTEIATASPPDPSPPPSAPAPASASAMTNQAPAPTITPPTQPPLQPQTQTPTQTPTPPQPPSPKPPPPKKKPPVYDPQGI